MKCKVELVVGLNGTTLHTTSIDLDPATVGGACRTHGSLHILRMGRHYDHYYDARVDLSVRSTAEIYSKPVFNFHTKAKSLEVKGQIGESVGSLLMRHVLGLSTSDIRPLLVDGNRKTPDFQIFWSGAEVFLKGRVTPVPVEWPLECKSRPAQKSSTQEAFFAALPQLATYWLYRGPYSTGSVGFGLICITYNEMRNASLHIVLPKDKTRLERLIADTHNDLENSVEGYAANFTSSTEFVRDVLHNCKGKK